MMNGKVCLVTGATAGIGKVTAAALAEQGAQVVIVGRNRPKTEQVVQTMRTETGNSDIHYLLADFLEFQQVRDLAEAFRAEYSQLDVLVNNAGTFFNARHQTPYGVEKTLLVNHLSPFLLTNLLRDTMRMSAPARIVNLSSAAHAYDDMNFDDLDFSHSTYVGIKGYARSKLANILFTYELDRRLVGSDITVNAVHPGRVATDIWRSNFPVIGSVLKWGMSLFSLTPEEGADNSIHLASSPEVEGITGKYFVEREAVDSSPLSYDEQVAKGLWDLSEEITGLRETA